MSDGARGSPRGFVELSLEEEWPRLRAQLELRDSTWLSFVFCSSPEQARELLARARSQLRAGGRGITVVPATEPEAVVTLVDSLMRTTAPHGSLTWVDGVALRVKRRDAATFWEQALLRANDHRDALLRRHADGLVFCLPTELKTVVRETAPDLWAKRVLAMEVDPPLKLLPVPEGRVIDVPAGPAEQIVVAPPLDPNVARGQVLGEELSRVRALRATGNDVEAIALLEGALARDAPANERAQALTELAEAREAQDDVPGAIRVLEEALSTGGLTRRQLERAIDRLEDLAEREGRPELAGAAAGAHVALLRDGEPASLAHSLDQLGYRLSELGRHEDALAASEESLALYRSLAEGHSEAFVPDVARALHNLSSALSNLGRYEDSLAAIEESSALRRALAEARPDEYTPDLASSLAMLSSTLERLGRYEAALAAAEESVTLYRALADAHPDALSANLARALNNLSISLSDLGRYEDALAAIEEAVTVCLPLAEAGPDAFLPDLATSLGNLSISLYNVGRIEEAVAANEKATALYRALAEARPDAFLFRSGAIPKQPLEQPVGPRP